MCFGLIRRPNNMHRLHGLQLLRAFAAISVLIGHTIAEAEHYLDQSLYLNVIPWTRGVDLFFVISGFIITLSAHRFENRPITFLWRRLLRVAPLYYGFTTLMVITILILPGATKDAGFDLGQIFSSYAFLPFERSDGRIAPVLSLGWTLNYEVFFYVLCAVSLALHQSLIPVIAMLIALSTLGLCLQFNSPTWIFWTNPIVIEFLFGILLAKAYSARLLRPHRRLSGFVFVIGLILLLGLTQTTWPRFITAGVPAAVMVFAGTLLYPNTLSKIEILGDASYALYLSHRFVLRATTFVVLPFLAPTQIGVVIYATLTSLLAIGTSVFVHLWLEKPLSSHINRMAHS